MKVLRRPSAGILALVSFLPLVAADAAAGPRTRRNLTALDRYVSKPDPSYRYTVVSTVRGESATTYIVDLTSQKWRSEGEVDRTEWKHWLTIVRPAKVTTSTGLLFINGGSNGRRAPTGADLIFAGLAVRTGSVVADLRMVPNEPLTFQGESKSRTEDGIIAYTWQKYLETGDETWPLRLPMTKSAVRAMDTVTALAGSAEGGGVKVDRFVVAGGSKRGWTTWTTAAVDDRVVAIAPFVIDVLNNEKSLEHHYRAYGFWAPAIGDYTGQGLMKWTGTPQWRALMKIEDPYSYRERLTLPKLVVNSTGDQYFLPDSSQFYFDDLRGEKHLRYVPNTNHSLNGSDAPATLQAFYESILGGTPRPRYSWRFEKDGSILFEAKDPVSDVKLWQATNPKTRDFRLDVVGPIYKGTPLGPAREGVYVARVEPPAEGWTAFFIEATFPGSGKTPLKLTSGIRVTPDRLPFAAPAPGTGRGSR